MSIKHYTICIFHTWPYLVSILTIIKLWEKSYHLSLMLEEIEAAKDLNNTTARVTKLPSEPRPTQNKIGMSSIVPFKKAKWKGSLPEVWIKSRTLL